MLKIQPFFLIACLIGGSALLLHADDAEPDAADAAPAASAQDVEAWIRQLDSDIYAERQEASESLAAAGDAAVEALELAAQDAQQTEVSARAIDILIKLYNDENEAAQEALERLAEGESMANAAAADALKEEDEPNEGHIPSFNQEGGITIRGISTFRVETSGANGESITAVEENGVRTVTVTNSERTIVLVRNAEGEVTATVTTQNDEGEEDVVTYEAESLEALGEVAPEGFALFEEYFEVNPGIQIHFGGMGGGVFPPGMIPPDFFPLPGGEEGFPGNPEFPEFPQFPGFPGGPDIFGEQSIEEEIESIEQLSIEQLQRELEERLEILRRQQQEREE